MLDGIQSHSTQHISSVIPKLAGGIAVGRLMNGDGENQGNRINGDGLDRIVSNHGNMISIGAQSD